MADGDGPIIVTTVISSRADADIARDMKKANLTSKFKNISFCMPNLGDVLSPQAQMMIKLFC